MILDLHRMLRTRRIMFLLSLVGLFVSTYLFVTYVSGAPIACGVAHGCDVVRVSRWANMFGLPTPLFGMMFYAGVAGLLILRTAAPTHRNVFWYRLTMVAAAIGILESGFLTYVQIEEIKSFCSWCLASAVVATLLFIVCWGDRAHTIEPKESVKELKFQFISFTAALIVGAIAIVVLTLPHANGEPPVIRPTDLGADRLQEAKTRLVPDGVTYEGLKDAKVTVVEFVDIQCPACRLAHPVIKSVRKDLEGRIRFVYRQFPLTTIHADSALAAQAAVCADAQGELFQFMDEVMTSDGIKRDDLVKIAADLRLDLNTFVSCMTAQDTIDRVAKDVADGRALGVSSTPTIFVNEIMIDGLPNAEQLKQVIEGSLSGN